MVHSRNCRPGEYTPTNWKQHWVNHQDKTPQHMVDTRPSSKATGKRKEGKGVCGKARNTKRERKRVTLPTEYEVHEMLIAYTTLNCGAAPHPPGDRSMLKQRRPAKRALATVAALADAYGVASSYFRHKSTAVRERRSLAPDEFVPPVSLGAPRGPSVTSRSRAGSGRTRGYVIDGGNAIQIADIQVGDDPGPSDPIDDEQKKDPDSPIGVGGDIVPLAFSRGSEPVPALMILEPTTEAPGFEVVRTIPLTGRAVDFATAIAIGELRDGGTPEIVIGTSDKGLDFYRVIPSIRGPFGEAFVGTQVNAITLERYAFSRLNEAPTDVAVTTGEAVDDDSEVIVGLPGGSGAPSVNVNEVENLPVPPCTEADFNSDYEVNALDLAYILGFWGPCQSGPCSIYDLNGDGSVDSQDLGLLFTNWGSCGP